MQIWQKKLSESISYLNHGCNNTTMVMKQDFEEKTARIFLNGLYIRSLTGSFLLLASEQNSIAQYWDYG